MDNTQKSIIQREGRSVVGGRETLLYLIDGSGSMAEGILHSEIPLKDYSGEMGDKSKIGTVKQALKAYMTKRLAMSASALDKTGIIIFGQNPYYFKEVMAAAKTIQDTHEAKERAIKKAAAAGADDEEMDNLKEDLKDGSVDIEDPMFADLSKEEKLELQRLLKAETELNTYAHGDVSTVFEPTTLTPTHLGFIDELCACNGTPMYEGFRQAAEVLDRTAEGLARIVLITDGVPTTSNPKKVIDFVKEISENLGIVVDAIGIGQNTTTANQLDPYDTRQELNFNPNMLKTLAEKGKGSFYSVANAVELDILLQRMESERRALMEHGVMLLTDGQQAQPTE